MDLGSGIRPKTGAECLKKEGKKAEKSLQQYKTIISGQ